MRGTCLLVSLSSLASDKKPPLNISGNNMSDFLSAEKNKE
jgi:hypothetical protein